MVTKPKGRTKPNAGHELSGWRDQTLARMRALISSGKSKPSKKAKP